MSNAVQSSAALYFDHIYFSYAGQSQAAVTDITLDIQPGELVMLVGPSGCGKSTLLRLVAGLEFPDSGRLLIDGAETSTLPPHRRQVGWVPQSYGLFDHLNVAENVAFGLRMQGVEKSSRKQRVAEMLDLCRITELANRSVRALSGGQRQRVAIARALATYPRVLLLDEPLAALDPQLRGALRADLEALLRRSGVTTLFVTHDQAEALAVADRVVVLRAGKIEQFDTPERLWNTPANPFVAEFVSGAQIVTAQRCEDGRYEIAPGLKVALSAAYQDERVQLALRVTDFVATAGEGSVLCVTAVEFAAGGYLLTGQLTNGQTVSLLHPQRLSPGTLLNVRMAADAVTVIAAQ